MIKQDFSRLFSKGNEYSERPLNTFMWEGAEYIIHAAVGQGVIEFWAERTIREVRGSAWGAAMDMSKRLLRQLGWGLSGSGLYSCGSLILI